MLPKYACLRRHARKTERIARPLFSGYLFVVDSSRQGWRAINSTLGVSRLVAAAEVPEAVIAGLRTRESEDGCVRLEPQRHLKNGDKVRALIDPETLAAA